VNCVVPWGTFSTDPDAYRRDSRFHPEIDFFAKSAGQMGDYDRSMRTHRGVLERPFAVPEDVSAAVLYLPSDRGAFASGQVFTIEGGTLG